MAVLIVRQTKNDKINENYMNIENERIIERLKKDFSGSPDYHSGVNDGMYHLMRNVTFESERLRNFINNVIFKDGFYNEGALKAWKEYKINDNDKCE